MEIEVQDLETRVKPTKGQIAAAMLVPGYLTYKAATIPMPEDKDAPPFPYYHRLFGVSLGLLIDSQKAKAWIYTIDALSNLFS